MRIPLRHDRRLMPQEPLHLVQIHSALDHSRGTGMAQIVEMEVCHLGFLQREMQTATDVACIQPCLCFAGKYQFRVHRMAKRFRLRRESFVLERAEGYVKVLKNRLSVSDHASGFWNTVRRTPWEAEWMYCPPLISGRFVNNRKPYLLQ